MPKHPKMKEKKLFVISLGGSIIIPEPQKISISFLKKFKKLVLGFLKRGYRFVIVAGGGKISRLYQKAAKEIISVPDEDLDWLGIHATRLNAQLLRTIFRQEACPVVLDDPFKKVDISKYRIIIASGWRPGFSTDLDAVLLAKRLGAGKIINLTNTPYVYDRDVAKYKSAKPFKYISWDDYIKLAGDRWFPGLSLPFDPIASRLARRNKKEVIIAKGTDLKNLKNLLEGKKFKGTVIS